MAVSPILSPHDKNPCLHGTEAHGESKYDVWCGKTVTVLCIFMSFASDYNCKVTVKLESGLMKSGCQADTKPWAVRHVAVSLPQQQQWTAETVWRPAPSSSSSGKNLSPPCEAASSARALSSTPDSPKPQNTLRLLEASLKHKIYSHIQWRHAEVTKPSFGFWHTT